MKVEKVLIVEDYSFFQTLLHDFVEMVFGKEVKIFIATTLEEAEQVFVEYSNSLSFILMDTSLGKGVNTFQFVTRISKIYRNPIIATSTDEEHQKVMLKLGCTHACNKDKVGEFLKKWK